MDECLISQDDQGRSQDQDATHKTRACTNCARLKMKCQWPSSGSGRVEKTCSRCLRMKLDCRIPEITQRRKRGKSTRVAQLEKKIDGIVSLLSANQRKGLSPLTPESPQDSHSHPQCSTHTHTQETPFTTNHDRINQIPDDSIRFSTDVELFPGFRVSQIEASERLDVYRRDYVPHFPFVPVPTSMCASELYVESRLLFWTILAVVSPLGEKVQMEFKAWFRRYLAEHIVVRQEKTIDLLQAMLIYLAWNDFHFYGELQVTNIVQMAIGLVIDLRLDKPSGHFLGGPKTLLGDAWTSMGKHHIRVKVHQTPADKRAVLGVYHITNLLSPYFRKSTIFNWSTHLASCCLSLAEAREYDSDIYLVSLVRMQHMADRGFSVIPAIDPFDPTPPTFHSVTAMALDTVHRELENYYKLQPESVKQIPGFRAHYNSIIVRLYEPVLVMKPSSLISPDTPLSEPFLRTEYLWKCLEAIRNTLENHTTLPPEKISILPVTVSCVLAFVTVTASRLIMAENSTDWDVKAARRRLQFQDILQRLSDQFAQADEEAQRLNRRRRVMEDGSSVFLKSCFKVRWIRQWYLSKIPQEELQLIEQPQTTVEQSNALQNNPDWATNLQFDDDFWADLLTGFDMEAFEKSLNTTVAAVQDN
ncbi:cercosporin resistance [Fusarium beomiforme]|uniref:Cercosporin resistance n=1 Tax=Fusarium beomiforme TaxID=44412 RepID=A0A9P5AU35_9HYPO|nr:cercosporin resistance [Fusarium beomiforme]